MHRKTANRSVSLLGLLAVLVSPVAPAAINGLTGPTFDLTATQDFITTADGNTVTIWGYGETGVDKRAQYPGPTLIVDQGDTVSITLNNGLPLGPGGNKFENNVSMVFPGQSNVTATCTSGGTDGNCVDGLLTLEAGIDGDQVTYSFVAGEPGTYLYHSGTRPDLQVEMGMFGTLIVRPSQGANQAYNHPDTAFDHEYLFVLSEMDVNVHVAVALAKNQDQIDAINPSDPLKDGSGYFPVYWFVSGRTGPDTLSADGVPWLPTQPYSSLTRVHPGETALMRVVGMSRDSHPFHYHGNHALIIAKDGRMMSSGPGAGPDLSRADFTIQSQPGTTYDLLFDWTGDKLGWDLYGTPDQPNHDGSDHCCNGICLSACLATNSCASAGFDPVTHEYCPDHGKRVPVTLPELSDLAFGAWWSGSPFLGQAGDLPPGEGGLNPTSGYFFMWHSHSEKELTNFDIFPGGMLTMLIVEHPDVPIE
jgi:hypothetical protein